jgi:hypothetical protein
MTAPFGYPVDEEVHTFRARRRFGVVAHLNRQSKEGVRHDGGVLADQLPLG